MDSQPWLDRVRERLVKHGLPLSYIQRFVAELADHFHDFKEEGLEADASARLGEPEQVADAAVVAYRRRSFLGRHRTAAFLVFAISPIISQCVLMWAGVVVLLTFGGNQAFDWYEHHWSLSLMTVFCAAFLSILYGELAMRLGIGRKWMLASSVVLGAIAMFWEYGIGMYAVSVMLLVQFAAPITVGWWFTRRECNYRNAVMTFVVFAISPVASYMLLFLILSLAISAPLLVCRHFGHAAVAAWSYVVFPLMFLVPTVMASILCYKLAKRFGSGRKWMVVSCMVPAMLAAMPFMPFLLIYLVPTVVASLLYCKLAIRSGIGGKWICISCVVLATWAPMHYSQSVSRGSYDGSAHWLLAVGMTCIGLAQCVVPLAIGWWFLRRKHDQGQLQLAS